MTDDEMSRRLRSAADFFANSKPILLFPSSPMPGSWKKRKSWKRLREKRMARVSDGNMQVRGAAGAEHDEAADLVLAAMPPLERPAPAGPVRVVRSPVRHQRPARTSGASSAPAGASKRTRQSQKREAA